MTRRHFPMSLLVLGFLLLLLPGTAHAALGVDVTFTPTCDGYNLRGGSVTADRNNTGNGFEALITVARDGSGSLIYQSHTVYPVNQRIVLASNDFVSWTYAPQSNPIIMHLISPAGNGYEPQLVYTVTGSCANLPVVGDGTFALIDLSRFSVSPDENTPYDPNSPLPRPVNPPGLAQSQPAQVTASVNDLLMRSGDGVQYTPVAVLDRGTELIVLGTNGENWLYIEVGGIRGWVNSLFVSRTGELTGIPVVMANGTLIPATLHVRVRNPIYSTSAPSGAVLCQIEGDRSYTIVARDSALARWYQIEATCDGEPLLGWIRAARGQLNNPANVTIPIY